MMNPPLFLLATLYLFLIVAFVVVVDRINGEEHNNYNDNNNGLRNDNVEDTTTTIYNPDSDSDYDLVDEDYYAIMREDRSGAAIHDMLMAHAYVYMKQNEVLEYNRIIDNILDSKNNDNDNDETGTVTANRIDSSMNTPLVSSLSIPITSTKAARYVVSGKVIDNIRRPHIHFAGICPHALVENVKRTISLLYNLGLENALKIHCPDGIFTSETDYPGFPNRTILFLQETVYRRYDSQLFTNDWQMHLRSQMNVPETVRTKYVIVAHVRRGDVDVCNYPGRYLPDSHYIQLIEEYTTILLQEMNNNVNGNDNGNNDINNNIQKEIEVIVFSESSENVSFDAYLQRNYILSLDTPLLETWNAMMHADVLIMSRSSFSYVPALFNPNKVVYTPFWHEQPPNFNHWRTVSDELLRTTETELHTMQQRLNCPNNRML